MEAAAAAAAAATAPAPSPSTDPSPGPQQEGVERVVVADAMDRLIESCERDLWPPPAAAKLLGLYSRERNVEEARYA